MKRSLMLAEIAIIIIAFAACQTTKPVMQPQTPQEGLQAKLTPTSPGPCSIQTASSGFSPRSDSSQTTIQLNIKASHNDAVKSWKIAFASDQGVQRTLSGTSLPDIVTWDGRNDSGSNAIEGSYTATLYLDYGEAFLQASATSGSFVLDQNPPTAVISLSSDYFAPSNPGDLLTISITSVHSIAKIASWTMDIKDPGGSLFKSYRDTWPNYQVSWDGKADNGGSISSGEVYPVEVRLRDEYGNVGTIDSMVPIDIIVVKDAQGYRIPNSRIFFKAFTADYSDIAPDLVAQNTSRLDRLAAELKKFPGYKIKIVGHAVMIHWGNKKLGEIEQNEVLLPLSKARAQAIEKALVERGLKADLIATDGEGADHPVVPNSDLVNRWKNRRTVIYLVK